MVTDSIRYVFGLLATLVISLVVWWFIFGGAVFGTNAPIWVQQSPMQRSLWVMASGYFRDMWNIATLNDGVDKVNEMHLEWNAVSDVASENAVVNN